MAIKSGSDGAMAGRCDNVLHLMADGVQVIADVLIQIN